ncbi:hypothetical protein ACH4FX_39040 [Streptomyces sp. NPDC018019]|uniref:hypothetical protein n=1 Tax=Streptomyces sp. NPDC018019 TaxID=3365030 RepID=UPI00379341EC
MATTVDFTALSDADAATTSDLAARRRATALVPDLHATYRAQLVTAYVTSADPFEQLALYAEAVEYDRAYPDEPPLAAELYGADQGEVA